MTCQARKNAQPKSNQNPSSIRKSRLAKEWVGPVDRQGAKGTLGESKTIREDYIQVLASVFTVQQPELGIMGHLAYLSET